MGLGREGSIWPRGENPWEWLRSRGLPARALAQDWGKGKKRTFAFAVSNIPPSLGPNTLCLLRIYSRESDRLLSPYQDPSVFLYSVNSFDSHTQTPALRVGGCCLRVSGEELGSLVPSSCTRIVTPRGGRAMARSP